MSDSVPEVKKSAGLPPWMATFADMMALMMTFFVLLFASSSVERHKFDMVAGSLKEAFGGVQYIKSNSTDLTKGMEAGIITKPGAAPIPFNKNQPQVQKQIAQSYIEKKNQQSDLLLGQLKTELEQELQNQSIVLEREGEDLVIRFPEHVSFPSGSATLVANAAPMIDRIVSLLRDDQTIVVAGHTDNHPLRGGLFHSNWELSAARAASVADAILRTGRILPTQMMVAGYADTRPIENNDTADNRANNRRVEIILKNLPPDSNRPIMP
jgi:chemotaxis protein MotB